MSEISDKLWLAIDYMGAKNSYGAVSFGLSYAITPDASFIIGYDIWNDLHQLQANRNGPDRFQSAGCAGLVQKSGQEIALPTNATDKKKAS